MANKSLLTYGSKVFEASQVYYAPILTLPQLNGRNLVSLYAVLSKVDNWVDDNNPPSPTQDQNKTKNFLKNAFVAKKITSNNISPVIPRIDWVANTVYDYYRSDIDMFQVDSNDNPILTFYVKNRYDQVFKCLWNNNDGPSTYEPYFQPGSYNTNGIYQNLDGYKWKYIYTVDTSLKINFMDSTWMPVSLSPTNLNPLLSTEGYGGIEVLNVINQGSGYNPSESIINVLIQGDGYGANATPVISSNGQITDIIMTSAGANYTYANVFIQTANGSGVLLEANTISPIGGHGYDPISELGCKNVMLSLQFNGSENGFIPTDIIYHQLGILVNPTALSTNPYTANGSIYKTSTSLIVSDGFGVYTNDEIVYQGNSPTDYTFIGTVLDFNTSTNELLVINTTGTLNINLPVFGSTSGTARTLLNYTIPDFITLSGYLVYYENRSSVTRSVDGIEQFKIVLGY